MLFSLKTCFWCAKSLHSGKIPLLSYLKNPISTTAKKKGRKAFEMIKSEMQWELMPYDTAVRPNLSGKGGMSPIFDECQKDYAEHGFKYVMKKYIDAEL